MDEVGLIFRWGKLVPGRERQGIDVFNEATEYFGKKISEGVITFFEPFFYETTDLETETGFFIIKGPREKVFALMASEDYLFLLTKASFLVEHFTVEMLTVGDGILDRVGRAHKVLADMGV